MSKARLAIVAIVLVVGWWLFRSYETTTTSFDSQIAERSEQINTQEWKTFIAPDDSFKVMVPVLPQHAAERMDDPKTKEAREYDMYVAEKGNGTIFMISRVTLLDKLAFNVNDKTVSEVMDRLLANNPNSKLKSMKESTYKGHPAIDFTIESDLIYLDGKALIIGPTLYLLTSVGNANLYSPKEFEYFVDSFQLLTPELAQPKKSP